MKKWFLLGVLAVMAAGCGGSGEGGPADPVGEGRVTIKWPADTRFLPAASASVRLDLRYGTTLHKTVVVVRPSGGGTTTTTLTDLPFGALTINASAQPQANGGGVAQAVGSTTVAVTPDDPFEAGMSLVSTITGFSVTIPDREDLEIEDGEKVTLSVQAVDEDGSVVLTRGGDIVVTSADTKIATVSGFEVTGVKAGTVTLNIQEKDSGKTGTAQLTVVEPD